MKFTKENCLGDDHGKAFAMALLEKSGLEIDYKETDFHGFTGVKNKEVKFFHNGTFRDITWPSFFICFENLFNLFSDPLSPTQEECTMFSLEFGVEYIIKPEQQECNTSE